MIVSQLEPSYPSVRANRFSPLVVRTLKGALRRFSGPVRQKSPLTRDDLKLVYQDLPHPLSHDHLLFVTILLVGFFGLLRLGELVQSDMPHLRSISKISWRHDVQLSATSLSFSIPLSKSDHFFEGDRVVIQKSSSAPDPGDWVIAFGKTTQVITFALPGQHAEYTTNWTCLGVAPGREASTTEMEWSTSG